MIFIFNNGRSYSDRRIYFIEPAASEVEKLAEFFDNYAKAWPDPDNFGYGFLIAKVRDADWFSTRCTTAQFIEDVEFLMPERCFDVEAAQKCLAVAQSLLPENYWQEREFFLHGGAK